jgi:hypothetical protein
MQICPKQALSLAQRRFSMRLTRCCSDAPTVAAALGYEFFWKRCFICVGGSPTAVTLARVCRAARDAAPQCVHASIEFQVAVFDQVRSRLRSLSRVCGSRSAALAVLAAMCKHYLEPTLGKTLPPLAFCDLPLSDERFLWFGRGGCH